MFVKNLLNLLAIFCLSVCVTPFSTMTVLYIFYILVFDRISLIVFQVLLMSFLKRLNHNSKYICLAA